MLRWTILPLLLLELAACDQPTGGTLADAAGEDGAGSDASTDAASALDASADANSLSLDASRPDASSDGDLGADAAGDACVPFLRITAQFTVNDIIGTGPSTLDVLRDRSGSLTLNFRAHTIVYGADSGGSGPADLVTGVTSTGWTADFAGADGDFLDREIGAHLSIGGAFMNSVIELRRNQLYLYILPADTEAHPYFEVRCMDRVLPTDDRNFPVLQTATYTGCSAVFFDFRGETEKNLVAQDNTTLEVLYAPCSR